MNDRKILLLRVGLDMGAGGGLGPLFAGNRFEYVPIPERIRVGSRQVLYSDLSARNVDGSISKFVRSKFRNGPVHYDPEFETFTYGDPTPHKSGQLKRMTKGDLVVFFAGLRQPSHRKGSKLFIIGYLFVRQIHSGIPLRPWPPPKLKRLWNNAHFRRNLPEESLVVVEGFRKKSRLLNIAIPLSDDRQCILPAMARRLGLIGSVKRSGSGRNDRAESRDKPDQLARQWGAMLARRQYAGIFTRSSRRRTSCPSKNAASARSIQMCWTCAASLWKARRSCPSDKSV